MSYLSNKDARKIALTAICPVCRADAGVPCKDLLMPSTEIPGYHVVRLAYARDPLRNAHLLETTKFKP